MSTPFSWFCLTIFLAALPTSVSGQSQSPDRQAVASNRPAHSAPAAYPAQRARQPSGHFDSLPGEHRNGSGRLATAQSPNRQSRRVNHPDAARQPITGPLAGNSKESPRLARRQSKRLDGPSGDRSPTPIRSLVTMASSLAVVLGLFLLIVWFTRRNGGKPIPNLPTEVMETLGRAAIGTRRQLHLVRLGNKLLLLHVSSTGIESVAEIDEPAQVDRIAGLCQRHRPGSISNTFRDVLTHFDRDSTVDQPQGSTRASGLHQSHSAQAMGKARR